MLLVFVGLASALDISSTLSVDQAQTTTEIVTTTITVTTNTTETSTFRTTTNSTYTSLTTTNSTGATLVTATTTYVLTAYITTATSTVSTTSYATKTETKTSSETTTVTSTSTIPIEILGEGLTVLLIAAIVVAGLLLGCLGITSHGALLGSLATAGAAFIAGGAIFGWSGFTIGIVLATSLWIAGVIGCLLSRRRKKGPISQDENSPEKSDG